jgi:type II secretory pathway pseudopilin PulG
MSTCYDRAGARRAGRARQRGDMLMEALVALLLLSVLGGGLVYVATNVMGAQRDTRMEGLAVVSMRQLLRTEGEALCAGPATRRIRIGGDDLALEVDARVTCDASAPQVAVQASGTSAITVEAPRAISLSLPATALGLPAGADIVVGTRQ